MSIETELYDINALVFDMYVVFTLESRCNV